MPMDEWAMANEIFRSFVRLGETEAWQDWIAALCCELWEAGL